MYTLKAASARSAVAVRSARKATGVLRVPSTVVAPRSVVARAESKSGETDPSAQFQEYINKSGEWLQKQWENTADAEKPAAVAIILGATVAQIAIGATMDAVNRIPFVNGFLEFIGLAVTSVYLYRYVTDPSERDTVKATVESFVKSVTGK